LQPRVVCACALTGARSIALTKTKIRVMSFLVPAG
jgi:hypothetical protein